MSKARAGACFGIVSSFAVSCAAPHGSDATIDSQASRSSAALEASAAPDVAPPCPAGEVRRQGSCVPVPAPIPLTPWSTSYVTSARPRFRWSTETGWYGGVVEICADRACATLEETVVSPLFDEARPDAPLGAGRHYFRIRGLALLVEGTATSATWPFYVGARSAEHAASWGSVLDLDDDGFSDVLVGLDGTAVNPTAYLYRGSASGLPSSPTLTLQDPIQPNGGDFGSTGVKVGDVNGDGYADVVVGGELSGASTGALFVY
jgi:hypothetical protein